MRFVILGAGAVGGVIGARLHQAGFDVTLIARGSHLEAIRRDGLTLLTPVERVTLTVPAAAHPGEVDWSEDDVVLLATKSQDTLGALTALRAAAGTTVPLVCVQNGAQLGVRDIDGRRRPGSSTWQSLARGTGTVETDYLNGEIVLQGRLHDVPTPVNAALCRLAAQAAREGRGGRGPVLVGAEDVLAVAA